MGLRGQRRLKRVGLGMTENEQKWERVEYALIWKEEHIAVDMAKVPGGRQEKGLNERGETGNLTGGRRMW